MRYTIASGRTPALLPRLDGKRPPATGGELRQAAGAGAAGRHRISDAQATETRVIV